MFNLQNSSDYMNEMYRLFPKSETIESLNNARNYKSPFQTANANKSSSSPDSISPESYFDMPFCNRQSELRTRCETPKPTYYGSQYGSTTNIYDSQSNFESSILNMSPRNIDQRGMYESPTYGSCHNRDVTNFINYDSINPTISESPFPVRRQRPIVGRKILGNSHTKQEKETCWQFEGLSITPPERTIRSYELFPSENKEHVFNDLINNPIKPPPHFDTLSNSSNVCHPLNSYTQNSNNSRLQMHSQFNYVTNVTSYSSTDDVGQSTMCTFCRKNGETAVVYMTHCVKKKIGNRHIVTCPILRSHVCQTCGASGDNAHTMTYCPVLRRSNNGMPLQSTTITLKNTRVKSNGRKRF